MGTHPIFESDFDCLTDKMKLPFLLVVVAAAALELTKLSSDEISQRPKRYLLYDTNPGEGFNLRRDVFTRIAVLVKYMRQFDNWHLVLPPWGRIGYHWRERGMEQSKIPWSKFFDLEQLNRYIPAIELVDYFEEIGEEKVDEIWYLQNYAEGWGGKWEEKIHERECINQPAYQTDSSRQFRGWFFGYESMYANAFKCVSVQGFSTVVTEPLNGANTTAQSVMLDRGENLLHRYYGQFHFWSARRAMRFSDELRDFATAYRLTNFDSSDKADKTSIWTQNWDEVERPEGSAKGGAYLAVHLRRKDFLRARAKELPSIKGAVEQIEEYMKLAKVDKVFIATDGVEGERVQLRQLLGDRVFFYDPTPEEEKQFKKGGVAIIDQIICAHAAYFIGSKESTFSFRIQEEREIMGFTAESTYKRLCPDDRRRACTKKESEDPEKHACCHHHTHWKIAYTRQYGEDF